MWIILYFILSTLETIALFIYNLLQESSSQEWVWLHYSAERIVLIGLTLLAALLLGVLTLRSIRRRNNKEYSINRLLKNESGLWRLMLANLVMAVLLTVIFILPSALFRDYQAVLESLKPVLIWLLVICLQTFFFVFLWYCVHFVEKPQTESSSEMGELLWVLVIFTLGLVIKLLFVLPNGYGMLKDVGETKYLYMLQYFNEGIFLHSATEFTTHYPPLYTLALMFTFSIRNHAFEGIKLLNALMTSGLIFPLYLLSRRFLDKHKSLVVIALSSLIPFQLLMPIRLLSENLYFPLLMGVLYLIFVRPADDRYRLAWDCLTGFALGLLYLTRYISLALIPFLLLVWWLKPFTGAKRIFHLYPRKLVYLSAVLLVTVLTYLPWIIVGKVNGLPLSQMLGFGIAADTNPVQLTVVNLLKWLLLYAGYYILLAAPVLNMLMIGMGKKGSWQDEETRWKIFMFVLLLAFGIAIVRHSWRADYNLELPKRLMGRYVVYFVPLFIMSAFLAFKNFDRAHYRNLAEFLLLHEALPLILVIFSYELLIKGNIVPLNAEFIHPLISIDGYYIRLLGGYFFVLLVVLYTGGNLLLWYGRKELTLIAALGLAVFYLAGEPAYIGLMVKDQTAQQIGKIALDAMLAANANAGKALDYEVLLPDDLTGDEMDDAAWAIFIRNPESQWEVGRYYPQKVSDLDGKANIVILPVAEAGNSLTGEYRTVMINNDAYALQVLLPD